ncbi:MAG: hypothetical protein HY319_07235 [Armatimonadetes bacterium]|nr:hypothetical protein [Armatimonadota bacterium]
MSVDTILDYEELKLPDGRSLRRYADGRIRLENPLSGVIHEERPDGSLLISLPTGRVIFQEYRGEPLLVYHTDHQTGSGIARVGAVRLPGSAQLAYAIHFRDSHGHHLVELQTLRYYRVKKGIA